MLADPHETLEFQLIVDLVRRFAPSPLGALRLSQVVDSPRSRSADAAKADLELVGESIAWLRAVARADDRKVLPVPQFTGLRAVHEPVSRLSMEGVTLDAREIREILELLDSAQSIRSRLLGAPAERPGLHAMGIDLPDLAMLTDELSGKILPTDEISSLASTALSRVRRHIEKQKRVVEESLGKFVRRHARSGVLRDRYVTMRNGRTVVPVKAQWKSRVDGIVHGASTSGQTVFVEPIDTIVQNNRLVRLREDEHAEVLRILRSMSGRLRTRRREIATTLDVVAEAEYVFARARFAREFRCCLPRFCRPGRARVRIERGRHPLLQDLLQDDDRRPVPMDLHLRNGRRTMILSGPNAGGKTVVLKTVGLLAAMAQAGLPVPADSAEFPWFDGLLADIGDDQSISESHSTFSAHIAKLSAILGRVTSASLVLLDELGTATDPEDGGALAVAVVERLQEAECFLIVSTHLPELKMYGARTSGILSASMGYDDGSGSVTYRLHTGLPGRSAGLDMAEQYGMLPAVMRRARALRGRGGEQVAAYLAKLQQQARDHDELLQQARARARDLENEKKRIAAEAARRERKWRVEAEVRIEKLVRRLEKRFRESLRSSLAKIKATVSRKQARTLDRGAAQAVGRFREAAGREIAAALGERAAARASGPADDFVPGQRVRVLSMGVAGELVRRTERGRWLVQAGSVRLQVTADDLEPEAEGPVGPTRLPDGVRLRMARDMEEAPSEINVIGKSADEALMKVDRFLDRAVLANKSRLRVIHGFGKDILRRELWRMLAQHVHVSRYYQADQQEGGAGATIVEVGGS